MPLNAVSAANKPWHKPAAVLLAGLLQALCFAPGPLPAWLLPFAQIASLAVLFAVTISAQSLQRAAGYAILFGCAQFGLGVYWLSISMHQYGGMPLVLALAALLLFAVAMSLYGALACAIGWWLNRGYNHVRQPALGQLITVMAWASAWVLLELLRGYLFTGFTWLVGGYAHVEGMFAAWAPIIGVYGLSWLAAFAAGAIVFMLRAKNQTPYDRGAALLLGLALLSGMVGIALAWVSWSQPLGQAIVIRLVQPATALATKFNPAALLPTQQRLQEIAGLAAKSPQDQPDVIILPETAVPMFQYQVPEQVWQGWQNTADQMQATIILGLAMQRLSATGDSIISNSAIALQPQRPWQEQLEGQTWVYDKRHLVPFGEFVPTGFRWFVDAMHIPLGDFNRGLPLQAPLASGGQQIALNICYEDTFGEEIAATIAPDNNHYPGASILANISELAWFGNSWAMRQHLQMARMRALESVRPMVRATNTGISAVIDPLGQVLGQLQANVPGVLDAQVQGMQGISPYVRYGNLPIVLWCLFGLGLAGARRFKNTA